MKRTRKSIVAIALAIVCCIASITPISAYASYVQKKSVDFSASTDDTLFSTTYGGWSSSDGVYKANNAWANAYLSEKISFATDKVISFDFCLKNDSDQGHQFNVGLVNISEGAFTGGVSAHIYYNATHGIEMGSLNSEFGSCTGGTWYADTTNNYYDGTSHTMTITVEDKTASFQIDGASVFKSVEVGLDEAYLVFQSTSTEYYIDNIKLQTELIEYKSLDVDFEESADGNLFATTSTGWTVENGTYHANTAWATTYLDGVIPLDETREISFDFCLKNDSDAAHQFNVGLSNVSGADITGGATVHFYRHSGLNMELVTLNGTFGSPTGAGWLADSTTNYYDGQKHTMTITVKDKIATYKIDGTDILASAALGMDKVYLVLQATSTEYTVDNLKIGTVIPEYTSLDLDFEETTDADVFDGNWSVSDGVYHADAAWATTNLNGVIPLNEDKEISFDFCLKNDNDAGHQFNVGLTSVQGTDFIGGATVHFYYHGGLSMELVTLNGTFGSPTGAGWLADSTTNYYDGQTHTMTIIIKDKVATYKIDDTEVLTSATLGLDAVSLVLQTTSTEYTVDNLKVGAYTEPAPGPGPGPGPTPGPSEITYSEMEIDFAETEDGDVFASTANGWAVSDGVYKPTGAWETTYLNCEIPLDEDKEISFDFCIKDYKDAAHQFNFAFADIEGQTITSSLAGHFYLHAQHGELLTLNRDFGNPVGSGWIADNTDNYADGKQHKMIIQVKDGKVKLYIDQKVIFENVALNTDAAYFIMQYTSADSYIDNFKTADTLTKIQSTGGETGSSSTPATKPNKYKEVTIDFNATSDGNDFATNNAGFVVKNGVYKASTPWATTYLNYQIPLNENKEISFDFCLKNGKDKDHQFNIGFVTMTGNVVNKGGLAGHFFKHKQHGELFTLNRDFGNPVGEGWIADNTNNYNDGKKHHMVITVKNNKATFYIDGTLIFGNIDIQLKSAYFIMQFTSVNSYVDNLKVSDKLTMKAVTTGGTNEAATGKYKELDIDFEDAGDADVFATNHLGWVMEDGVYKASGAWATAYPNFKIPVNEEKEISFDFCLKNDGAKDHQFNIGFVDIANNIVSKGGLAGHFYCHAQYGELFTLNRDFGNPIGEGWIADNMDNFNDGEVHNMMIRIKDGKATFMIDGKVIFEEIEIGMTSAYFIMQFTSTDSYIDNFKVSDTWTYIPDYPTNTPDPTDDETGTNADDDKLVSTEGTMMGAGVWIAIAGAVIALAGVGGFVFYKKKKRVKADE